MDLSITNFPRIRKCITEMGYDNGCINRQFTEEQVIESAWSALTLRFHIGDISRTEAYLATLSDEELVELCCGEQQEPQDQDQYSASRMLNCLFDHLVPED